MHQFEIKMCKENLNIEILKKLKKNGTALKFNRIEKLKTRVSLTKNEGRLSWRRLFQVALL